MATFDELIQSDQPVLVDFFAEWCGPCKAMSPVLKGVAQRLGTKAKILKVDIDKNAMAALKYNVRSVPTLMVFKHGQIKWRHTGVVSESQLTEILGNYIQE